MSIAATIIKGLVAPVANAYGKRQVRKQAAETGRAKIALAKDSNDFEIKLTDAEWEAQSKKNETESWKDEYVTILITSPFILVFVAACVGAHTGNFDLLDAVKEGFGALKELGVELGDLMYLVVLAAIGIKGVSALKR